jgi:ubiquinone/menaquinone biosynthesis C-methylase UbiE
MLLALKHDIISILRKSPTDQYYIYRKLRSVKMSEILKAITKLEGENIIYVMSHRKNKRTGLNIPIYSLVSGLHEGSRLNIDSLLAGVYTERVVEYSFLERNLISTSVSAKILDIGSAESALTKEISKLGIGRWSVIGIDVRGMPITQSSSPFVFLRMDSRKLAFRDEVFDQVICISTIEHVGIPSETYGIHEKDDIGDLITISEIYRILKKGSTLVLTLPYGKMTQGKDHRIYDRNSLANLISKFSRVKSEFYRYDKGKWKKCTNQSAVDNMANREQTPLYLHSGICVCLWLKK